MAGKRTTFKKDDMKMIEPQTIEFGSIHLRDELVPFWFP